MTTLENGHEPNPQQKRRQGKRRRFLNAIEKGPFWCSAVLLSLLLIFPKTFDSRSTCGGRSAVGSYGYGYVCPGEMAAFRVAVDRQSGRVSITARNVLVSPQFGCWTLSFQIGKLVARLVLGRRNESLSARSSESWHGCSVRQWFFFADGPRGWNADTRCGHLVDRHFEPERVRKKRSAAGRSESRRRGAARARQIRPLIARLEQANGGAF